MHLIQRVIMSLAAVAGAAALAGAALAATGASASAAPLGPVGFHYSTHLAGFSLDGNGADVFDGVWRQVTVPSEAGQGIPADSVAVGIILAENVSTGVTADAEALVWDDPASTCGADSWVVEDGTGAISLPTQPVLPTTDLHPVLYFGGDICMSAGSEFLYLYHSRGFRLTRVSAGASSHDWNVLDTLSDGVIDMRTGGEGVTTTSGTAAGLLATGLVEGPAGTGFYLQGHGNSYFGQGLNLSNANYDVWEGTLTGAAPSVVNPLTLTENPTTLVPPYGVSQTDAP